MDSLTDLESRTKRLETLLLPKPDYRPEIYDFLIEAEMATAGRTESEAIEIYGDKETFVNDYRRD